MGIFPKLIPQQRKLMGSSAQNSIGVHWCRRRVKFNQVPAGRPWCRARSGSTGFWRRFREALLQSQVRFNRVREKVLEKVPGGFGAEPGQVQQGSGEGSGQRSGRLWCRARSCSTGFRRRFREALVQRQVRFNRVPPEQVPEKVLGIFGAGPCQVQQFNRVSSAWICKNETLRLLGIPPKLIFYVLFW